MSRSGRPGSSESPDHTTRTSSGSPSDVQEIGPYRLLERIGVGGMGEVYLAEQTHPLQRTVAFKVIKAGMDTRDVIARFEAERQALALMDHPCIATVLDAGSTPQGRPYFVMEYVRGVPITTYCDKQRLTTRQRLDLFLQLCQGVQHAHQRAILHRDLKPSNVLVTVVGDKPVPKIIDFGVAKATARKLTEKTMHTALGELIGTPEYMSPEQAEMSGEHVDTRTDVYSLGVILYELLSGSLPFESEELRKGGFESIVRTLREKDAPRPSTKVGTLGEKGASIAHARRTVLEKLRGQLRGDLDWITLKALEKDRTRRYASVADLAADVRRHMRHEPVLACPPSTTYRLGRFVRRHRVGVAFASVLATLLTGFAVTMGVQAGRIARERDRANAEAERASKEARASKEVSEFLVGLFQVSDPQEARGKTITAREILDRGAGRIERELHEDPLLRARMMDTMGRVYQNLGLYTQAESLLVDALAIRERQLGPEDLVSIESASHLGWLRFWQSRWDDAKEIFTRNLALRESLLGPEHVDTAWSLYYLGATHVMSGDPTQGRRDIERALPIFERELGPESEAVAWCLNDLAICLDQQQDYEGALAYLRRSLEIKRKVLGPDHYDTAMAQNNIAELLAELGRPDEAKRQLLQSLAAMEKVLGPDHPWVGINLTTLGDLQRRLEEYGDSRTSLQRAERIFKKDWPHVFWAWPECLELLALLEQETGHVAQADSLFQLALRTREETLRPNHPWIAQSIDKYAAFLRAVGRSEDASALERQAAEIRQAAAVNDSVK